MSTSLLRFATRRALTNQLLVSHGVRSLSTSVTCQQNEDDIGFCDMVIKFSEKVRDRQTNRLGERKREKQLLHLSFERFPPQLSLTLHMFLLHF